MSNGKIDYALGLETSGLLGKLTGVNQAFDLMGKVIEGVGTISRGVFDEIERGAALQDLSNRTGETVGNLFQLQFAFEQSGIAAGNVPGTLLRFQKSLSGVGEMGENTAEAFAALKLNIADLQNLDSPTALAKIFQGLNGLDRNSAADVASRIFGRGSSGDILQLARDSEGFAQSLADAARQAALFERSADAFDKFGDTIGQIKLELRGVFAAIAEDITPAMQTLLDTFRSGDVEKFGEALRLSLIVAFGESVNFFAKALQAVFASIPDMMKAAEVGSSAVGDRLFAGLLDLTAANWAAMPDLLPFGDALGENFKTSAAFLNQLADQFRGGAAGFEDVMPLIADGITKALTADTRNIIDTSAARAALAALGAVAVAPGPRGPGVGTNNMVSSFSKSAFGDANALERVGASFGGGGTADVQRKQLSVQQQILKSNNQLIAEVRKMDRRFDVLNQ